MCYVGMYMYHMDHMTYAQIPGTSTFIFKQDTDLLKLLLSIKLVCVCIGACMPQGYE